MVSWFVNSSGFGTGKREAVSSTNCCAKRRRPAALSNLKLRYEDLKDRYPRMIYAYGTGFGEEGSEADRPGFDVITYWGRSGIETSMFPYEGWLRSVPPGTGDHPSGLARA